MIKNPFDTPTLRVLSVDWDYYIKATEEERDKLFISSEFELSEAKAKDNAWAVCYTSNPELIDIDIDMAKFTSLQSYMHRFLEFRHYEKNRLVTPYLCAHENHGELYTIIQNYLREHPEKTELEVVNIDYHHDCFLYGGENLNCSNWVRLLYENPDIPFRYSWIRGKDSQPENNYKMRTYLTLSRFMKFNPKFRPEIIFFCRSDTWTPPHLDKKLYKFLSPYNRALGIEGFEHLKPRELFDLWD